MIDPIELAKRQFPQVKPVSTQKITFNEQVRKLCEQNSCGNYGRNWTCPPVVATIEHFRHTITQFDTLLIMFKVYSIKSSFDWDGMLAGAQRFMKALQVLKKEITSADADFNFLILGAGACNLCETCSYINGKPCRHPRDAIVSLEACGIDVMRLFRENDLTYYHGKETVTYIGGLLYDRQLKNPVEPKNRLSS